MNIRLLLALAGLVIGFALPALTQQKDAVDPKMAEQIRALTMKYDEAFNKNDAVAVKIHRDSSTESNPWSVN
jgi:hypothetical protein